MENNKKFGLEWMVDFPILYKNLSEKYFDNIEEIIRMPVHPNHLGNPELKGAEPAINHTLNLWVKNLKDVFPGADIFWDFQKLFSSSYNSYKIIVDVVDGGRNLRRGGDDVTSTLVAIDSENNIPLAIVSYPFRMVRYVDFNGEAYWLPNNFEETREYNEKGLDYFKIDPKKTKNNLEELRVLERCDMSREDYLRKKLDELRDILDGRVMRFVGSLSKMLMTLVTGTSDVFISKKKRKEPFHDYAAAKKIILDLGGKFTDLDGEDLKKEKEINGIIAASSEQNYNLITNFIFKK